MRGMGPKRRLPPKPAAFPNKGIKSGAMPDRAVVTGLNRAGGASMNDYAKATPMAQGVPAGNMEGAGKPPWPPI